MSSSMLEGVKVFLSDHKIDMADFQLSRRKYEKIGYRKGSVTDREERFAIWKNISMR
ncbi:hypothetical protein [Sulfurovum mangrovi]|uniref:hypothetical protein n=1 Tax=Sulfurovum mangrovi TaxID=2893889 RepID=UPI001E3FDFA9|nr:hypothetical protein [Sulfurovum mangrovi]UFH58457.1 hypothetical protein LN246_08850 [Sulfurovum mangrovi]